MRVSAKMAFCCAMSKRSDVDLTVTIGESVLVTRMSAWAASLREILK